MQLSVRGRALAALVVAGLVVACGDAFTSAGGGTDSGANDASTGDASTGDASTADALADVVRSDGAAIVDAFSDARDDAGNLCPGADIFHPGPQARMVGTPVPFVGGGRDSSCTRITGSKLVWTDSLEGMIGTGETFSHTFTMLGSHTVTLTATDGQGAMYTATVTFMII